MYIAKTSHEILSIDEEYYEVHKPCPSGNEMLKISRNTYENLMNKVEHQRITINKLIDNNIELVRKLEVYENKGIHNCLNCENCKVINGCIGAIYDTKNQKCTKYKEKQLRNTY